MMPPPVPILLDELDPVVGVTDVWSTGTTSLAGKPVAGVMENASTSTFLPLVHASHARS